MPIPPESFDADAGGLLAQSAPGDNAPPFTVTEIASLLKRTVEDRFGHVRVRGEISGFKRAASGHVYLALKDADAVLDGVMWRGTAQRLAFAAEDGLDVIATGKLTTYPGRSKYQIVIESLELAGEGALMQLLEKLKARLAAEGLFAAERKRPLPFLPRTIGVVTSPTGSVIRDILHRLADRFPSHVLVWPVLVQGEGAAAQVAGAVRGFGAMPPERRPDLLIVARGGGSIEDLWAFNEEVVVRAIAESPIPVISAVGHETDTTLADHAADRRAPTPTAAAEMAVPVRADLLAAVGDLGVRSQRAVQRRHELARERLSGWAERLPALSALLQPQQQRADDLAERLRQGLALRLATARADLGRVAGGLRPALLDQRWRQGRDRLVGVGLRPALLDQPVRQSSERFAGLSRLLDQLHPDRPLALGYARVLAPDGAPLVDRAGAAAQAAMTLRFRDGELAVVNPAVSPAGGTSPRKPAPKVKDKAKDKSGGAQPRLL